MPYFSYTHYILEMTLAGKSNEIMPEKTFNILLSIYKQPQYTTVYFRDHFNIN